MLHCQREEPERYKGRMPTPSLPSEHKHLTSNTALKQHHHQFLFSIMKLVALVALALLPIALGTPVSDSASDARRRAPDDTETAQTAKFRVTAHELNCRSQPNTDGKILRVYYNGDVLTIPCYEHGESVYGNE